MSSIFKGSELFSTRIGIIFDLGFFVWDNASWNLGVWFLYVIVKALHLIDIISNDNYSERSWCKIS